MTKKASVLLLLLGVIQLSPSGTQVQVISAAILVGMSLAAQMHFRPCVDSEMPMFDVASLISQFLTLSCVLLFFSDLSADSRTFVTVL